MNDHEEKLISAFIPKEKQDRYRFLLSSPDPARRTECTNRLNHCRDINEKYATWLPRNPLGSYLRAREIAAQLRKMGSPEKVYVLSVSSKVDGQTLPLEEAMEQVEREGWGTLVSCIAGQLAYFFDEEGKRRAILERKPGT